MSVNERWSRRQRIDVPNTAQPAVSDEAKKLGRESAAAAVLGAMGTYANKRAEAAAEIPEENGRWGVRHVKREARIAWKIKGPVSRAMLAAAATVVVGEVLRNGPPPMRKPK